MGRRPVAGSEKGPTVRSYRTEDWLHKEVAAVMQTVVGSKRKNGDIGRRPPWGDADGGEEQRRRSGKGRSRL
uniref:Uncharacterized protein n=1 Tax=Oryza rufipogon TaxID=4529 RepID=A0A0E0P5G2_ORYRU